jgi:hypothetical protein
MQIHIKNIVKNESLVSPANIPYSRIVLVFADLPFELQRIA